MTKILIAKIVAYVIAVVAAASSYGHQVHLLGLADLDPLFGVVPAEWVTPATVDSLAIIALMVRGSDSVDIALKRWALLPLALAGGMSVAANVATARDTVGIVVGVWTVAAYIIAELFVGQMEKKSTKQEAQAVPLPPAPVAVTQPPVAPAVTQVTPVTPVVAPRSRRCADGCTCGKHKRRNTIRDLEQSFAMAEAPVSGA